MATLTYEVESAKYAVHKERIIRRLNSKYLLYLEDNELSDTSTNQNNFIRLEGKSVLDKWLTDLEAHDISEQLRSQITDSGLS